MSDPLLWTSENMPVPAVTAEQMREVEQTAVEEFSVAMVPHAIAAARPTEWTQISSLRCVILGQRIAGQAGDQRR